MKLVVKKFGGTSVGDLGRISQVAELLRKFLAENPGVGLVVVVSAMAGETNRLTALAKSLVAEPDPRELDTLLATGEQVSIALVSIALRQLGIPARSFDAQQAQIATNNRHLEAQIEGINAAALNAALARGEIPVVAGFQGVDEEGSITTLGRGGSDITAVAIAAALKADACYIYTDVDGVYSTDPRICRYAKRLTQTSHEEMLEMASLGAKVLHPRSVYFAMQYAVPLVVLSTFNPERGGTWVVPEEELVEKAVVTGITYRNDEAKISVHHMPQGIKSFNLVFSALAEQGIFVDMITQAGAADGTTTVSFTVPDEASSKALALMQALVPKIKAEGASLERDIAKISVVGVGMRYHTGVAAKLFEALAAEGIDVSMIATSEIKISVLVPRKFSEVSIRALHRAFIENQPEIALERGAAAV
ncbi:MAG: aspartate kinase [Oligoflexia bacterium]|nr:aspartate kinase [Oligoflexia bacterium]